MDRGDDVNYILCFQISALSYKSGAYVKWTVVPLILLETNFLLHSLSCLTHDILREAAFEGKFWIHRTYYSINFFLNNIALDNLKFDIILNAHFEKVAVLT